jgi:hypothetical protein
MTRSRKTAREAGTKFETSIVRYLADVLGDDRIERRAKFGGKDRGDIAGVRVHGQKVVIEAKDYGGRVEIGPWLNEAEVERGNDDALVGLVVAKRRGMGNPADQLVVMTVADLVALMSGSRPSPSGSLLGDRPPGDAA